MTQSLLPKFWYIVAESRELTARSLLSRQILDEWLVCYRDKNGKATVLQDRCLHRCNRLSKGKIDEGKLTCNYHGWVYGEQGKVVEVPSQLKDFLEKVNLKATSYPTHEQDGYIYVCLDEDPKITPPPFIAPTPPGTKWRRIRMQNRFSNSLANCVENYIDVPHTAYVHHGIFRTPHQQKLQILVRREKGHVIAEYCGETINLGSFSWLLNPKKLPIKHLDHFYAPNITSVHYQLPSGYSYYITSQSIPISAMETLVYTDISYDFGFWTPLAKWIVRRQAQRVIDQDIDILKEQGEVIQKYGEKYYSTPVDYIHILTREIIHTLESGKELSTLENKEKEIQFLL